MCFVPFRRTGTRFTRSVLGLPGIFYQTKLFQDIDVVHKGIIGTGVFLNPGGMILLVKRQISVNFFNSYLHALTGPDPFGFSYLFVYFTTSAGQVLG